MQKTIEGINFDIAEIKKYIDANGKDKFIERAKELYWTNEMPPINDAAQLKRINAVIAAACPDKEKPSKK